MINKIQKFNYMLLLLLIFFSILIISCGINSKNTSESNISSNVDSTRYWHININVPMGTAAIEQEFWFDSKAGKLIRIKDMFNDVTGLQAVDDFGYNIISGDFTKTTVVEYSGKPPYVSYTFETTAFVTVKLMNSIYKGTWGISEKSSKYN